MTLTLYEMQISPHARKVRLLASELGLKLDTVQVDPRVGETRSKDFLSKNPNGRVPTLDDDGFILYESPAIMKYLAAKKPERGLAGKDTKTQALIDQWICWWVGGPEAAMDALAWELLIKPNFLKQPGNDPGIMADARARLDRFLPVLDQQLEGRDFVLGDLSVVDFLIGPRLDTGPAFLKFDISGYKNINAWLTRLSAKPYWKTA
ncbi:MAG TPA: glutathione S-transferase family protein [Methyloceanibacter sp.]|jgi:glutathione S-transferase|nr:glutathione S-transferase family protein [Methyloceanibacter sp.]